MYAKAFKYALQFLALGPNAILQDLQLLALEGALTAMDYALVS